MYGYIDYEYRLENNKMYKINKKNGSNITFS